MTPADIIEAVAADFDLTSEDIRGWSRTRRASMARHVACYLMRKHLLPVRSLSEIGAELGRRDHSTVIYSIRRCQDEVQRDHRWADRVASIALRLGAVSRDRMRRCPATGALVGGGR